MLIALNTICLTRKNPVTNFLTNKEEQMLLLPRHIYKKIQRNKDDYNMTLFIVSKNSFHK